jgi:glutamate 5-kinase
MFTDNDELSGLIASMMGMEALIILSNVDGIYKGSPADPESEVIGKIHKKDNIAEFIRTSKSAFGRGGMTTKAAIARKIADEGIEVYIANGKQKNILTRLMDKKDDVVCTHFVASKDSVSSVKKWIAHSEDFVKGKIFVNANAAKALMGDKAVSLLPVGVTSIAGEFEKDDIVKIVDEKGKNLGIGKVQYSSSKARELIGLKNQKPIVHYDYLYLE